MKKKDKILFGVLLLIFIFLLIGVKYGMTENIDYFIYDTIKNWQSREVTDVLKVITNLGGIVSLFCIAFFVVFILFLCHKRKEGVAITLNLIISSFSYFLLKSIIQRPRPPIEERLIEATGYSFPSGHTTNNVAFYALAICLIYQNINNKKIRNTICILLGIMPVLIGFSRVYLRVHYVSDVLAGFCLGIMCVMLFISYAYQKIRD